MKFTCAPARIYRRWTGRDCGSDQHDGSQTRSGYTPRDRGATAIRNLYKCVEELGVEVLSLAFSGYASSFACLSDTEKELGVVLVDIGGGQRMLRFS